MISKPNLCRQAVRAAIISTAAAATLQGAPALAQSSFELEEVVVTARKISESAQDVPIALSAISSNTIDELAIKDLSDISKITAGLVFDNEFSRVSDRPVIRGQGTILGESGVSYFIDGVYINGSLAGYDLNDVERVEVIKGPQSALYGRNTYSGAINMITKSPGDEFSSDIKIELAEDGQYDVSGAIRGPITDTLGGSISGRYYERDGVFENQFDGDDIGEQESQNIAALLEWNPSDDLRIRTRAAWAELEDGQPALFSQPASENNCYEDNGSLYQGLGRYYCGTLKPRDVDSDWTVQAPDAQDSVETLQVSLNIDWNIGDNWTLTSITGYNERDYTQISEADYSPTSFQVANFTPNGFPYAGFPVPPFDYAYVGSIVDFTFASESESEDWSQELRFSFEGDNTRALIGAYYYDGTTDSRSIRDLPDDAAAIAGRNYGIEFGRMQGVCAANPICGSIVPFFGPTIVVSRDQESEDIENMAAFGMWGWDFTETMTLTLEGRYQEEEISQDTIAQDLGGPVQNTTSASETFDSFSPRITLDWKFSDNSMLYALYAEGTKPGGFNGTEAIEAGVPSYDEEEVKSFEIGSKNVFDDGRLTANFALFFNDLEGYQLTQNVRTADLTNTTSAVTNAGDAEIFGFEAEMSWFPEAIEGLGMRFNYAWTDSEFTDGFDQNQGVLNDVADNGLVDCSTGNEFPDQDDCTSAYGSIDGKEIPRTAEHQAYVDFEYRRPFGEGDWEWSVGADYSYESSKWAQVHNLIETGDTNLVGARIGFTNGQYAVRLWGKNLTGEDSTPLALRYADGADSFKRSFVGMSRRDTYFGATFTAAF
ncbi:TonB-dependent receptor [Halioglobus maricola]|uniref:TonB-dependent receptor n=1 Tax=Halioglobus maricola TaxID=2601894 RepID=A0A5P9NJP5_9GAMM|nr:TonB-dependent receptor [Halioglobus maricola]QFU75726.1 TonB-dependent receptor [Halioglobus maricola]